MWGRKRTDQRLRHNDRDEACKFWWGDRSGSSVGVSQERCVVCRPLKVEEFGHGIQPGPLPAHRLEAERVARVREAIRKEAALDTLRLVKTAQVNWIGRRVVSLDDLEELSRRIRDGRLKI